MLSRCGAMRVKNEILRFHRGFGRFPPSRAFRRESDGVGMPGPGGPTGKSVSSFFATSPLGRRPLDKGMDVTTHEPKSPLMHGEVRAEDTPSRDGTDGVVETWWARQVQDASSSSASTASSSAAGADPTQPTDPGHVAVTVRMG